MKITKCELDFLSWRRVIDYVNNGLMEPKLFARWISTVDEISQGTWTRRLAACDNEVARLWRERRDRGQK